MRAPRALRLYHGSPHLDWMPQLEWYHGGSTIRDWSSIVWDRDRSTSDLNAEGPGMYWTTDFDEAASYLKPGGIIYRGEPRAGFRFLPKKRPDLRTLRALYELAGEEDQEIFLSNWGSEWPAPAAAVTEALRHYSRQETLHDALVTLYGDLFRKRADPYVAALRDLGYDGVVVEKGTTGGSRRRQHLILWNPDAMRIAEYD